MGSNMHTFTHATTVQRASNSASLHATQFHSIVVYCIPIFRRIINPLAENYTQYVCNLKNILQSRAISLKKIRHQ